MAVREGIQRVSDIARTNRGGADLMEALPAVQSRPSAAEMGVGEVTASASVEMAATEVRAAEMTTAVAPAAMATTAAMATAAMTTAAAPRERGAGHDCSQSDRNNKLRHRPRHGPLRAAEWSAKAG